MDQMPFRHASFAENPEPRVPCVLLVDVSQSMDGAPIKELNAGLAFYKSSLVGDSLAAKRVEVAVVVFGGQVKTVWEFTTAENFSPPTLATSGDTPMGAAIHYGIDMVQARKQIYRSNGIAFYRPWLFLITDGAPTDEWQSAADRVRQGEASRAFSFFVVGVNNADFAVLRQIAVREPLHLKGLQFRDLFLWLSNSQQSVSHSSPGDNVPLTNPATPDGWAVV